MKIISTIFYWAETWDQTTPLQLKTPLKRQGTIDTEAEARRFPHRHAIEQWRLICNFTLSTYMPEFYRKFQTHKWSPVCLLLSFRTIQYTVSSDSPRRLPHSPSFETSYLCAHSFTCPCITKQIGACFCFESSMNGAVNSTTTKKRFALDVNWNFSHLFFNSKDHTLWKWAHNRRTGGLSENMQCARYAR